MTSFEWIVTGAIALVFLWKGGRLALDVVRAYRALRRKARVDAIFEDHFRAQTERERARERELESRAGETR